MKSVWLRLLWKDTRLSWNPDDYGGVTYTHFEGSTFGGGMAGREIWLPDITPYNDRAPSVVSDAYRNVPIVFPGLAQSRQT